MLAKVQEELEYDGGQGRFAAYTAQLSKDNLLPLLSILTNSDWKQYEVYKSR